jgi:glycosyltransferase involved in cell wall biosynthesis
MKICLVSQEYPPETPWGGIATQTFNKARALAGLGHEVHVLTRSAEEGADLRTEVDRGVIVHLMKPPGYEFPIYSRMTYRLGYAWHVLAKLNELMERTAFDVFDFPEFGGEGFAYQLDRTMSNWVPVVVQLHGPLAMFIEYMGWPERGTRFAEVGSFMEEFCIKRADALMACSASVARLAERYYGIPAESIDVVHCGVDTGVFCPETEMRAVGEAALSRSGLPSRSWSRSASGTYQRPTVLFVGAIVENKGAKVLVEAVLRLRRKYPDIRLQLIGKGGPDLMDQLTAMISREQAEENVEFLGFVELEKLPSYYRSADLFCSPAAEYEGFGQVFLEAMGCGCPVVASTAGGGAEAVTHEETGMLVPPNDVAATADAIDRLLSYAEFRQRLSEQGRRRVEEYFVLDKFVRRVEAVYKKAIERSQSNPDRLQDVRE